MMHQTYHLYSKEFNMVAEPRFALPAANSTAWFRIKLQHSIYYLQWFDTVLKHMLVFLHHRACCTRVSSFLPQRPGSPACRAVRCGAVPSPPPTGCMHAGALRHRRHARCRWVTVTHQSVPPARGPVNEQTAGNICLHGWNHRWHPSCYFVTSISSRMTQQVFLTGFLKQPRELTEYYYLNVFSIL